MKNKPDVGKRSFLKRIFARKKVIEKAVEVDREVRAAVNEESQLEKRDVPDESPESSQQDAGEKVSGNQTSSSNSTAEQGVNAAASVAAVAAGVALTMPRPANAWVNDIVDGIVEKAGAAVLDPLKGLFGNLTEGFGLSNMFGTQEGAKAQGRSTDAINEVSHTVENAKVMRATEPPPHLCLSIQEKKYQLNVLAGEKSRVKRQQFTFYNEALNYGTGQHLSNVFGQVKEKSGAINTSEDVVKAFLKTSPVIAETEDSLSDETHANALLSVETMVAGAAEKIGKPNLRATGKFARSELIKIGRQNRLSIARNTLVKGVEEKFSGTRGEASRNEARKLMVDRTHGAGTEWYSEVLSKGDPVPLLKDELVLLGTSNSLLLDMLESCKETNKLLALQIVDQLERG